MTLSEEEYSDETDNLLLKKIKLSSWDDVANLLSKNHIMIKELDKFGNTALHAMIGFKAPEELLLTAIQLHPEATKQHGTDYWLPLHIAAMWGTTTKVMEAIIEQYPEALDDAGDSNSIKGRTPRHFSTRFNNKHRELLERSTIEWKQIIEEKKQA
eukprot:CAMPEP_0194143856 /NCGR_PEP_ID=MMETSP0152-20130528/12964_1 /TAXON_ID=1049557 /ORGANISM="Thalassiothrix antarctica, Strain L6-D1" /LENGTH=155 /DNA_ID=CAMNT_0038843445 /DNA_START=44 /DNA_END=507 /DNA_ORIENTATION=+